jgi:hypothetical protein
MEVEMRTTEIAADGALADTDLDPVEGAAACSDCSHSSGKGAGGASGIAPSGPANAAAMAIWKDLLRQNGF